jgi:hypothetical protein
VEALQRVGPEHPTSTFTYYGGGEESEGSKTGKAIGGKYYQYLHLTKTEDIRLKSAWEGRVALC